MKVLLSPTEDDLAEKLGDEGITSSIPEERGADVLLYSEHGLFGFQRKHVPTDLLLSVDDGRLARELPLLYKECTFSRLVYEGEFTYWPDGMVNLGYKAKNTPIRTHFNRDAVYGILNNIELQHGVITHHTKDIDDTIKYIRSIDKYLRAPKHYGLYKRPTLKGAWTVPSQQELHLWILQSFPGIGPSLADAILTHFNGKIPLKWTCTAEELQKVPRLPKTKALELVASLTAGRHIKGDDAQDIVDKIEKSSDVLSSFEQMRAKLRQIK